MTESAAPPSFREWLSQVRRATAAMLYATPGAWETAEELHAELHRSNMDRRECGVLAQARDAWLSTFNAWTCNCIDCGSTTSSEWYMVTDEVWKASGMCPYGFLCIACIELRLGRRLIVSDFTNVATNRNPNQQRSERLTVRITGA